MVVLGVILLGYISFDKLGIDLFPDLNSPRIFVEIQSGERPPEEMEKQYAYTSKEKFEKLREKNPHIDTLRKTFDLDI